MSERERSSLQRKLKHAEQQIANWQLCLDVNPNATAHQRGVWQGKINRAKRDQVAIQVRLAQA